MDLPFKAEVRSFKPSFTMLKSFDCYSNLKAKRGRLLGFGDSSLQTLTAYVVDESTLSAVLLELVADSFKIKVNPHAFRPCQAL